MVSITKNGMKVDCYGKFDPDNAVLVAGTYLNGCEFELTFDAGHLKNWTEVVVELTSWADSQGHKIIELSID
jgi:hypothetical protein